jgi:hypothetical protein
LDSHDNVALNLRLSNFSRQQVMATADIVAALDLLPARHLAGLREIIHAPHLHSPAFNARKAEYLQRQRSIIVYDMYSRAMFPHILYHEIGHHVFYLRLDSVVKKHWVTQLFPWSDCVTPYGARSASEDFAESYACYLLDPATLETIPDKYQFMRDHVFGATGAAFREKGHTA